MAWGLMLACCSFAGADATIVHLRLPKDPATGKSVTASGHSGWRERLNVAGFSVRRLFTASLTAVLAVGLHSPADAQTKSTATKSSTTAAKPAPSRTSLARQAALARARRAAAARRAREAQLRDAMTPKFKKDDLGNIVPDVRAAAAIIYDPQTGDVLWEANSHDQRSIASLTKLMTAVTFMADDPDLSQKITVTRADVTRASVTYIRAGEVLTYNDLLHLTLIASDNAAARVLARTSEGGTTAFVGRMNQMAANLGLKNSHYEDPSGLDADNVSSAYDISHLIAFANSDERLGPIMRTESYTVRTNRRSVTIRNTNKLLGEVDVVAGKTGFIRKAGYCLATLIQGPQGAPLAVVVLGAANSTVRFWEARHLFNWAVSRTQGLFVTAASPFVPTQD
jgi:D-alanyl-D-alanine endopeptidase (penicillin-binding protein 7)